MELQLTQQLISIRDGALSLRGFYDRQVADAAHRRGDEAGLSGDALAAVVEAAWLKAAVRTATESGDGLSPVAASQETGPETVYGTSAAEELDGLLKMAEAFKESPVVQAAVSEFRATSRPATH